MPVLFESLLDSTLGDGELHGGGFFVLFLLYALGPQGLSASGGPGVSVPASLCSGASCSGPSCFVVLGSLGGLATGLAGPGMGSRLRGNDDLAGLRVSGVLPPRERRFGGAQGERSLQRAQSLRQAQYERILRRAQTLQQAQGERILRRCSGQARHEQDPSTGSVRAELAAVLRAPPRPWVPASAGTTGELGSR